MLAEARMSAETPPAKVPLAEARTLGASRIQGAARMQGVAIILRGKGLGEGTGRCASRGTGHWQGPWQRDSRAVVVAGGGASGLGHDCRHGRCRVWRGSLKRLAVQGAPPAEARAASELGLERSDWDRAWRGTLHTSWALSELLAPKVPGSGPVTGEMRSDQNRAWRGSHHTFQSYTLSAPWWPVACPLFPWGRARLAGCGRPPGWPHRARPTASFWAAGVRQAGPGLGREGRQRHRAWQCSQQMSASGIRQTLSAQVGWFSLAGGEIRLCAWPEACPWLPLGCTKGGGRDRGQSRCP